MPLEHSIEHRYALKTALEQLLGRQAWYDLKKTTSLTSWRKYVLKSIKAIRIATIESVQVRDRAWTVAIEDNLNRGEQAAAKCRDIDDLLATFTATLLRRVFLQIGALPDRRTQNQVALTKNNWKMDSQRSVQYIRSQEQLENVFWFEQQSRLGFEQQMKLHNEHRWSKSPLPYSEWCRQREA